MSSPTVMQQPGDSAASLLHYQAYKKPGASEVSWTRFASANEEFNIAAAGGNKYLIKFESNFSKKHLATFSKKDSKLKEAIANQTTKLGKSATEGEILAAAQKQLLDAKILKILGIRGGPEDTDLCARCGHKRKNDPVGSGHSKTGNCMVTGCATTKCIGGFLTKYVSERTKEGKPLVDPLAGAMASESSCIVLNFIPKNEFETAVAASILLVDAKNDLADTPTTKGSPLVTLKWNFGGSRAGAVQHAKGGVVDKTDGTWCEVGARKVKGGPTGIAATWTIVHWEGQG